jgi:putative iron-dependent peroxidase
MDNVQSGILAPPPRLACYLTFCLKSHGAVAPAISSLLDIVDGNKVVLGFGYPVVGALNRQIDGLRIFPSFFGSGLALPSTPSALWFWVRANDRGQLLHLARKITDTIAPAFDRESILDAFVYDTGRDLTGYEDGTENPKGDKAVAAGIVLGKGEGMDGSSFVAVQKWVHDFTGFAKLSSKEQDDSIGRRRTDNEELADAPPSAHVKRTAQESFDPEAFVFRRSMPWGNGTEGGLNFVAFGKSFDAFEAQLKRMVGAEDGVVDGIFQYTRPVTGSYFWCPPMRGGRLDLRALGL